MKDVISNIAFNPYIFSLCLTFTIIRLNKLDFYYYICNSKKFTSGLDLRNKYSHSNSTLSEKENESNFYIVLLILIQLIIRINGELCWYDEQKLKLSNLLCK